MNWKMKKIGFKYYLNDLESSFLPKLWLICILIKAFFLFLNEQKTKKRLSLLIMKVQNDSLI